MVAAETACTLLRRVAAESAAHVRLLERLVETPSAPLRSPALCPGAAGGPSPRALALRLAVLSQAPPSARSLLAEALHATSTDNPTEAVGNTLKSAAEVAALDAAHRPSYWSSGGSATRDGEDCVTYRLAAEVCVVHAFALRPYQATWQLGLPVYSPLRVVAHLESLDEEAGYGLRSGARSYASPAFTVARDPSLQTFTLPRPVLCVGGVLRLQLCGRATAQHSDLRWYVCLAHARAIGTPLYGWRWSNATCRLEYDAQGDTIEAGASSEGSDSDEDEAMDEWVLADDSQGEEE